MAATVFVFLSCFLVICASYSTGPTCKKNETFVDCPNGCDPVNCPESFEQEQEWQESCIAPAVCGTPGCKCLPNYRLDSNGKCIFIGECPGICPKNEEFSSCTQGVCRAQNCTQLGKPLACFDIDEKSCTPGCVCKEGTLRDKNGNCVPEKKCPGLQEECKKNETFVDCPNGCDPVTCPESFEQEQEWQASCIAPAVCGIPGCKCLPNFRLDSYGKCIFIGECPGICPKNEEFSSCTQAVCRAQNCTQLGKPVACPDIDEKSCIPGCICEEGTVRDENGNCVSEEECPASVPACKKNETFVDCPNGCDPVDCPESFEQEQEWQASCIAPAVCGTPGCKCLPNYRLDSNGKCIFIGECPGICPKNEEFSSCTQAVCRAQNCTQLGKPVACPDIDEKSCIPGCICEEGTVRDENGNCVSEEECPVSVPACKKNETFVDCPNGCDPVDCPESFEQEQEWQASCIAPAVCGTPGCKCLPNYRLDSNGKCIFIGECPGICPKNEEFSSCTQAVCRAQNCTQLGKPVACPDIDEKSCTPGCVCEEGTVRDANGNCVSEEECAEIYN